MWELVFQNIFFFARLFSFLSRSTDNHESSFWGGYGIIAKIEWCALFQILGNGLSKCLLCVFVFLFIEKYRKR
jgi:hypothetical protein